MTIADHISGVFAGLVLGTPLCLSVILAARTFRKQSWPSLRKRRFQRVFSTILLTLGLPYTLANAVDAATHQSGNRWGIATAAVYLGYIMLLVPFSLVVAGALAYLARKTKAK
jgi:hypothetical protein